MKKSYNSKKHILTASAVIIAAALTVCSCSDWFEGKIAMDNTTMQGTLSGLLTPQVKITKLDAPRQLFATQGIYSGKIVVNWQASDNATSYRLERAVVKSAGADGTWTVPDESEFNSIADYVYSTVYTDTILSNPGSGNEEYEYRYYYRVCAENISKGYDSSEYTDPASSDMAGGSCGWLLAAPSSVEAWKGKSTSEIKITWNPISNAAGYKIYRGEKSNGTGSELIDTVRGNETSYLNAIIAAEQGTEFYYKITACTDQGSESAASSIAMGYSLKEGAPAAPANVKVDNGLGTSRTQLTVTWDAAAAAEGTDVKYSVYRTSSADSTYTPVKTNLSDTSYIDKSGLKTGLIYYYHIQTAATTDGETLKSAFSESGQDSSAPAMGFLLSPPSLVDIADGSAENEIIVRWTPAVGHDKPGMSLTYNIYYADAEEGPYYIITGGSAVSGTADSEGYLTLAVVKKNFYKISTINSAGIDQESVYSAAAAPVPAAPQNVTASKTQKIGTGSEWIPNDSGVYPVLITWEKPEADTPAGYYVYRSTKNNSGFRKLTEEPVTGTSYIDANSTAKAGTFYYYKVISLNSLNQGNKGNNPEEDAEHKCRGYGALTRDQWFREYNKSIASSQKKLTLMHKANDLDKIGSETVNGDISGTLSYKAAVAGLGAEITMPYKNYADFYIGSDSSLGVYFCLTGNTDTESNMSGNGKMKGTVKCTGMYPGSAIYNNLEIKGGAAGGGYYIVTTEDLDGNTIMTEDSVNWLVGEE